MSKVWVREGVFTTEQETVIKTVITEFDKQEREHNLLCNNINKNIEVSPMVSIFTIVLSLFVFIGIHL